ncbi:T9SS type A sorting domain-containing protein, partial [Candidatus Poribacteria bacterium]|nr:T9SS type A sorting domain-containing protein [Candidatus Poribacteria bacterium]
VIRDLSPLSNLNRLVNITMSNNPSADLSPLENLLSLRNFSSCGTPILDLTPLASPPKLRRIEICNGEISDLSPLEGLTGLRELYLVNNDIEDIEPLATLTGLTHLSLRQNEITDVTALAALPSLIVLDLQDNEIINFSPLNELERRGVSIIRNNNPGFATDPPKILGPWLWVIVPTDGRSGKEAAESGIDFLDQASNGTVTEQMVATQGAVQGVSVGKKVWKIGILSRRGGNNINDLVNKIGLGIDDINHHVAYGSIVLDSLQAQQSRLHVGSGDAVKVWFNGTLIHENAVDRDAEDYQDQPIPVSLKKGENILLVAVYEGKGWWSGFFGLDPATEYEARVPNYRAPVPHRADVNGDGRVSILDMIEVSRYFGSLKVDGSPANTNDDGVIDIKDLIFVAQHLGTQTNNEGSAPLSPALVENWIALAWDEYDGSIEFQEGITYLEDLLVLLTAEKLVENTVEKTALFANYPNPFNPETWIPYQLAVPSEVYMTIHSVTGQVVRTLALGHQSAGIYRSRTRAAYWNGKNEIGKPVASGIYFYTLKAGDFTATRKMLIRK